MTFTFTRPERRVAGEQGTEQSGYTLIELLIAIGIFSVVLAVAGAGLISMTQATRKVTNIGDAGAQIDRSIKLMGRQIPFAQDINIPAATASDAYMSYDLVDKNGALQCYQWHLITSTDLLQYATWTSGSTAAKSWITMSTGIINSPTTQAPFAFPSPNTVGSTFTHQRVLIDLLSSKGGNPAGTSEVKATYVGANTSINSNTNVCP
jgi:prepilin-type N-terminal cleavage/methylation domain-containing protein